MQQHTVPTAAANETAGPAVPAGPLPLFPGDEFPWPPNADDLPDSDGIPMESPRHYAQMNLLVVPLRRHWWERDDVFVAGDMFVYFSAQQALTRDFRGPDVFVVQGVPAGERRKWIVWLEEKAPDVVIELLSDSTRTEDMTTKKQVYQDKLRVPEYFWFDPFGDEWAGWALRDGFYEPIQPDAQGRLPSRQLGLLLVRWHGTYEGIEADWLRWATADGDLIPTSDEIADQAEQRAADAIAELERYRQRFGDLSQGAYP